MFSKAFRGGRPTNRCHFLPSGALSGEDVTPRVRQLIACAILLITAAGLLTVLNYAKFASTFENRTRDSHGIVVASMAETLEAQLALGLTIVDTPALRHVLERGKVLDPGILAIAVLDAHGSSSAIVGQGLPELWQDARTNPAQSYKPGYAKLKDHAAVAVPLRNAFNVSAGWLVLEYQLGDAREQTNQAFASLWPAGLLSLAGALVLLALAGPRLVARAGHDSVRGNRRLTLLLIGLLMLVQCVFAWSTYNAFTRIASDNAPMLGATLAHTVRPGLQRALDYDIPLNELRGVEEWLARALSVAPEFQAVAIRDNGGKTLFRAQSKSTVSDPASLVEYGFALEKQGLEVGRLQVSLDLQALAERSRQLAIEFVTILLIGALLSHEILKAISAAPVRMQGDDLARLRLPLFLFFLSSELPRSFLSVWASELAARPMPEAWQGGLIHAWLVPLASLPETVLATIPMSAFLLAVALSSPFAGKFCARRGARQLLFLSMALSFAAHVIALFTDSLLVLCLARSVAGVSFGFVSMAAFEYIGRQGGARATGMALYLTAYVAAGICGAGLGALIVDRAGIACVFVVGLGCSVLAALTLARVPVLPNTDYGSQPLLKALGQLLGTHSLPRLIVLIALPMQIVQQGLLFYWAPLALTALGERTSFVGLAMMGYFLLVLLLTGVSANLAERTGRHHLLIVAGLGLAAVSSMVAGLAYNSLAIAMGIVLIGVAWALGFPSQGRVSLRLSQPELVGGDPSVSIGVYRTIERMGAMVAPVFTALLIVSAGYARSATIMGGILLTCALAYGWISWRNRS